MSSELMTYYQYLYSDSQESDEKNCYNFITNLELPSITKEESKEYDKLITNKGCHAAIFQLFNKSLGLNGFSVEFYKTFWKYFNDLLLESVNFSLVQKRLSNSQYEGLITIILKPDKDNLDACNHRLITLQNCGYKILSKVIDNRLDPLLT